MDGLSLRLDGLGRGGRDSIAAPGEIWRVTAGQFLPPELSESTGVYRVYPAEMERDRTLEDGRRVVEEDWRFEWGVDVSGLETDLPGEGRQQWGLQELGAGGLDVLRAAVGGPVGVCEGCGETGEVVGLEVPFLRTGAMARVEG